MTPPLRLDGLTTEALMSGAERALPQLMERDGLVYADEDALRAALADAFIEGARAAAAELIAQFVEAGLDVQVDLQIVHAAEEADAV